MFQPQSSAAIVEVLLEDRPCYLIRNCLELSEQIAIFQDVRSRSNRTDNSSKPCVNPTPKTLIFDGNQSTLKFSSSAAADNVFNRLIVHNAKLALQREATKSQRLEILTNLQAAISTMSVGVIRYDVPDGKFPQHIDHCNDSSWVYLLSLGCSANFVAKGPLCDSKTKKGMVFQFNSGDVLVFDPSSDAAIVHGVESINNDGDECFPPDAVGCPEEFRQYRFGVQCRVQTQTP